MTKFKFTQKLYARIMSLLASIKEQPNIHASIKYICVHDRRFPCENINQWNKVENLFKSTACIREWVSEIESENGQCTLEILFMLFGCHLRKKLKFKVT